MFDLVAFMSSSGRNGNTNVVVAPGEDVYQGAGTANLRGRFNGRVVGGQVISAAIANLTGWRFHRTTDPNWDDPGAVGARDQTAAPTRQNWLPRKYQVGKDDLINAQCGNGNNAQYEAILLAIAEGAGFRMGTELEPIVPSLPDDAHWARAAGSATMVAGTWTNAPLTWQEVFEQNRMYNLHGLAVYGATMYAGRLNIPSGPHATYKPGVPGGDTATPPADSAFYFSEPVKFEGLNPPNLSGLCSGADTSQLVQALISRA